MFTPEIILGSGAAVMLFWMVGAHNRLVRLRSDIVAAFAPVDAEFAARQTLLLQLADTLAAPPPGGPLPAEPAVPQPALEALRAACAQADAARARVRNHPGSAAAMTSFRLAEEILADTRVRLPTALGANAGLAERQVQLVASDATLAFAQRQFNVAVQAYNLAVRQFPTWLVASLFKFRAAGAM
jgi:LemA protein